jgi:hypothetical protein
MSEPVNKERKPASRHRYMQWIVAIAVGVIVSLLVFERATDPEPTLQKAIEEAVVMEARLLLLSYVLPGGELQLVDPLAPDRKVGKTYIWPVQSGWEVSGYYRRDQQDPWHPFLMNLDASSQLTLLAVKDSNERLIGMSARDPKFSAVP